MQRSVVIAAVVGPLMIGCQHAPQAVPVPNEPLRVTWETASQAWWADLKVTEPAFPLLLQRLPDLTWRRLSVLPAADAAPTAVGRHEYQVPVLGCPVQAVLREGGSERMELTYADATPLKAPPTNDVKQPMTASTVVTVESYGSPGRATGLSCSAGTLPEAPEVFAVLLPHVADVAALLGTLQEDSRVSTLRARTAAAGGRLLTTHR